MNILLTGASGIVGRYIAQQLLENGHSVRGLSRQPEACREKFADLAEGVEWLEGDILDVLSLDKAIEGADAVIHAAGMVSFQPSDEKFLMLINHRGTENVVNACLRAGSRLLHISSVACISPGRPQPCEVDERQGFNSEKNASPYAVSKYLADMEVFRGREEGLKAALICPVVVLAPGRENESSASLIRYAMKPRWFQPSGWLNYIDARDLALFVSRVVEYSNFDGQRVIASGGCVPYADFFTLMAGLQGFSPPKFQTGKLMASLAWRLAALWSFISGTKPLLTRYTAVSAGKRIEFRSQLAETITGNISYHSLEQSLQWILSKNA